jgi:hypothetical protein
MNFERSEILIPVLDSLETDDQTRCWALAQKVLGDASSRGMMLSSGTVVLVFQAFQELLTKRSQDILSEIKRVLSGAYVEDFEAFEQALKEQWASRMQKINGIAAPQFTQSTVNIAGRFGQGLPNEAALSKHIDELQRREFAEVELFCRQLHDSQRPRLFLKAGEVFAGNRAARAIFKSAKRSLDVIDTYFGPEVFDMFEVCDPAVRIRLISDKANSVTKTAFNLFNTQLPSRLEFRTISQVIHDRFIIVDGAEALHLGHSIKDLGTKDSLIDSAEMEAHKQRFESLWLSGRPVS